MAYLKGAVRPRQHHDRPATRQIAGAEAGREHLRDDWLSNRVFTSYDDIVDHRCFAWNKLIDQPWKIMSIGMRNWPMGPDQRDLVLP